MKFKNSELVKINEELKSIDTKSISLPVKTAYAIVKNKNAIAAAIAPYNEVRNEIIARYSNGTASINQSENPEGFKNAVKDINALDNEELDVDIRMVSIDDLGTDSSIPLKLMEAISFMIKEERENVG